MRPSWIENAHKLRHLRDDLRKTVINRQEIGYVAEKRIEQALENQELLYSNDADQINYAAQNDMNQLLFEIRQQLGKSTQYFEEHDITKNENEMLNALQDPNSVIAIALNETLLGICGEEIVNYFASYSPPELGNLGISALLAFEATDVDTLNQHIADIVEKIISERDSQE